MVSRNASLLRASSLFAGPSSIDSLGLSHMHGSAGTFSLLIQTVRCSGARIGSPFATCSRWPTSGFPLTVIEGEPDAIGEGPMVGHSTRSSWPRAAGNPQISTLDDPHTRAVENSPSLSGCSMGSSQTSWMFTAGRMPLPVARTCVTFGAQEGSRRGQPWP